jgi:hypothetical protein
VHRIGIADRRQIGHRKLERPLAGDVALYLHRKAGIQPARKRYDAVVEIAAPAAESDNSPAAGVRRKAGRIDDLEREAIACDVARDGDGIDFRHADDASDRYRGI